MTLTALHPRLLGDWVGENRLWMNPTEPPLTSRSTLTVASTAQGRFLTLAYTWTFNDQPQDGLLLIGAPKAGEPASAGWVDSFHQSGKVMSCSGQATDTGVCVTGHYAAPPGPDWGWSLSVKASATGELIFEMHNIPPGGAPELAVRAVYRRP